MKNTQEQPGERPKMTPSETTLNLLLADLQKRFYAQADLRLFYRDRRALFGALTWPALWLDQRGVYCSQERYQALLIARLEAIQTHGDADSYGAFFPAYLLKCLQDWFAWHGENLYMELKHARNAVEVALLSIHFADESRAHTRPHHNEQNQIAELASLHKLLSTKKTSRKHLPSPNQTLLKLL